MSSQLPDQASIRRAARETVSEMLNGPVADDDALISSGRIDSLSILRLMSRLEDKLAITIRPDDLQPDDFDNIDLIVETVERATQV